MSDRFPLYNIDPKRLHAFAPNQEADTARRLSEEKARTAAAMAEEYANLHIPEDQLSFATRSGLGTWFKVAWNGAFMAGYRQAMRDQAKHQPDGEDFK